MKLSLPIYHLKRNAKQLARQQSIPLHDALNRIAAAEGFASWSLLAARHAEQSPAARLYARLQPGDMVLVGARPGQGKTLLALELAAETVRAGNHSMFFTLEYTEADIAQRLRTIDFDPDTHERFSYDCSDAICADYIIAQTHSLPAGTVIVIDYLQLLDQRRDNPPLAIQIDALETYATEHGLIMVFISQIARTFDPAKKALPNLSDVRLPNRVDLSVFTKTCFLHDGEVHHASA
jgi:replicative DNA helicase